MTSEALADSSSRATTLCPIKNETLLFFLYLRQILTNFHNFFRTIYNEELRNKNLLKFSPHLKSVAALPCET